MRNGRAGLLVCWCRRRDSNSHSFRHYPLKIACLPISPRRLMSASGWHEEPEGLFGFPDNPEFYSGKTRLSMNRLLFRQLFCRDLRCARGRCRGRHGGRRSGRRGRRRHGLHGGRSGCRGLQHAADPGGADVAEIGQRERGREEHAGQHRRRARQEVRAAAGAEQAARAAAAERGPMSAPLPCWMSTRPIIASAASICTARITFTSTFISSLLRLVRAAPLRQPLQ